MLDARDDAGPALVYADWLQAAGNPWGELISVQHALETAAGDPALVARERALLATLPLPDADLGTVTWRRGLIEAVHVFNERDWMDDGFAVLELVRPLFDLPMCAGLRELRTGVIRWDSNALDVPAVLEEAAARPFAVRLERLVLGDVPADVDMDHHVIGDVRRVLPKFPALKLLKLHSGAQRWEGPDLFEFGPLALPQLEWLIIETCAMSRERLEAVLQSALPSLRRLELWFGSPARDATATLEGLAPLLSGAVHGGVTRLGLRNAEFTDALADELGRSPLAGRLEQLDLSMGTLGRAGVQALVASAPRWARLTRLDVSDSFLDEEDVAALRAAFPRVALAAGSMDKEAWEGDRRYCSVHE